MYGTAFNTTSYLGSFDNAYSSMGFGNAFSSIGNSLNMADSLINGFTNMVRYDSMFGGNRGSFGGFGGSGGFGGMSQVDMLAQQGMSDAMQWAQYRDQLRSQGYSNLQINQIINNLKGTGSGGSNQSSSDPFWNLILNQGNNTGGSQGFGGNQSSGGLLDQLLMPLLLQNMLGGSSSEGNGLQNLFGSLLGFNQQNQSQQNPILSLLGNLL